MNIKYTIYRMKLRNELIKVPIEMLDITIEEAKREKERRQKNKKK